MADGSYLVSFGSYTFPTTQTQLRDNFYDVVPRTVRMPGMDGGFDQYGLQRAPKEIGNVSVTFDLLSETRDGMDALKDQIRSLAASGIQQLTKQFGSAGTRFCLARVSSVVMSEIPGRNTTLKQSVTIDFQVAVPFWLFAGTWGTVTPQLSLNGVTSATANIVQGGLFDSVAKITIAKTSGTASSAVRVSRFVGGVEFDFVRIEPAGGVQAGQTYIIDATTMTASGPITIYQNMGWLRPSWFRLMPGANDIRVSAGPHTGILTVKVEAYGRA